jgi:hypothetical protein
MENLSPLRPFAGFPAPSLAEIASLKSALEEEPSSSSQWYTFTIYSLKTLLGGPVTLDYLQEVKRSHKKTFFVYQPSVNMKPIGAHRALAGEISAFIRHKEIAEKLIQSSILDIYRLPQLENSCFYDLDHVSEERYETFFQEIKSIHFSYKNHLEDT